MGAISCFFEIMSGTTVSIGLGCRGLKDKDVFSVSDPYVTISRPDATGGFTTLRTSETKKNTLNPDWNDFLFIEKELNGKDKDLNLRIQVFDDDGKKGPDGKDKLLGTGFFSIRQLEAAALLKSTLPIQDGKKQKPAGQLVVRSCKIHERGKDGNNGSGYPRPNQVPPGIPGPSAGTPYPAQPASGYPQGGSGYPQRGPGYPQGGPGYPQGGPGYPQGVPGYPQGGPGYPQGGPGYPQGGLGYPQEGPGYPQGGPGYLQGGSAYPQGGPAYPQGGPAYPQGGHVNLQTGTGYQQGVSDSFFPPSNLPSGPAGGFYNPNA